jgi:hypothetical protein
MRTQPSSSSAVHGSPPSTEGNCAGRVKVRGHQTVTRNAHHNKDRGGGSREELSSSGERNVLITFGSATMMAQPRRVLNQTARRYRRQHT